MNSERFLAARAPTARAAAVTLLGVPYDRTQSYRRGAASGPAAIRAASQSIESYSPALDADLEEVALVDAGDLDVANHAPAAMVDAVAREIERLDDATQPFLLGGDHTVSVGAVRALAARHQGLCVVQLDAHTDLRDQYEGNAYSHACAMRRVWDVVGDDRLVQAGVRSGVREEFAFARSHGRWSSDSLVIPEAVLTALRRRPIYLTVDIDVLDPGYAPGTSNPEPGGPAFNDLLSALTRLRGMRVVGLDLVEVSPPHDPSGITAIAAAKLVREMALLFASR